MDLFNDSTFDLIEESPVKGLKEVIDIAKAQLNEVNVSNHELKHEILWNTCVLISNVINTYSLEGLNAELPKADSNVSTAVRLLKNYLDQIESDVSLKVTQLNISDMNQKYSHKLKSSFAYEFSQGDYERVQSLLNELREHISSSTIIDENHKHRLLKKLERLQSELHKRVPDLDRLWGLVGDAGVALGKFGTDVKPLVERIQEIAGITWNTQKRAEELPSETPNPMLESSGE
ncbi:hypothetical protein [Aliivibrio fischeri]|uniref:Uncharacterized protein n=1 Tax=Aliivibrio fischeri SR5 TaxID=1088719 RepID=A0AAV3ELV3_ALIFS|nr:hypothetical protein [Aliivibrio fischeri]EHN67937.1 hypothetical protein VFSR5_2754 [Aliivibrio fischeri SR5]